MTESSIDTHMPDVWVTMPFGFNGMLPITSVNQEMDHQHHEKIDTNISRLPSIVIEKATCNQTTGSCGDDNGSDNNGNDSSDGDDDGGDYFEDYDPFETWYKGELDVARKKSAKRDRDGLGANKSTVSPGPAVPEETDHDRNIWESERLSLTARMGDAKRPYLSRRAQNFIRLMGRWEGFERYEGQLLHVDFTPAEVDTILEPLLGEFSGDTLARGLGDIATLNQDQWLEIVATELREPTKEDFIQFLQGKVVPKVILKGRTAGDILSFFKDCIHPRQQVCIQVSCAKAQMVSDAVQLSGPARRLRLGTGMGPRARERDHARTIGNCRIAASELLQPLRCFSGGSSDIMDVGWSLDGRRFALGSATLSDIYNRPGNLMLGSIDRMQVKLLDGHKTPRPIAQREATLDNHIRSTVTAVAFSNDSSLLYSSSYDKTIKIWEAEEGYLLDSVDLDSAVVNMEVSNPHNAVAASTLNGQVETFRVDDAGIMTNSTFEPTRNGLYASSLVWASGINPNWLFAGYDTKGATIGMTNSGDCVIYDACTQQRVQSVRPSSGRHFDMFLHQGSGILATGVSATYSKQFPRNSFIRLYSVSNQEGYSNHANRFAELDSLQKDINIVTISPCARFVTSSGTDNSTYVWDIRFPDNPLTRLCHGDTLLPTKPGCKLEEEDTGVLFAEWCPHDGYLYTGGSDGVVKVWDTSRGDSFLRDLPALDAQIMSGSFSPNFDMLLVGVASGKATLLSTRGDKGVAPAEFDVDLSNIIPDFDPDDGGASVSNTTNPDDDQDQYQGQDQGGDEVNDYYNMSALVIVDDPADEDYTIVER